MDYPEFKGNMDEYVTMIADSIPFEHLCFDSGDIDAVFVGEMLTAIDSFLRSKLIICQEAVDWMKAIHYGWTDTQCVFDLLAALSRSSRIAVEGVFDGRTYTRNTLTASIANLIRERIHTDNTHRKTMQGFEAARAWMISTGFNSIAMALWHTTVFICHHRLWATDCESGNNIAPAEEMAKTLLEKQNVLLGSFMGKDYDFADIHPMGDFIDIDKGEPSTEQTTVQWQFVAYPETGPLTTSDGGTVVDLFGDPELVFELQDQQLVDVVREFQEISTKRQQGQMRWQVLDNGLQAKVSCAVGNTFHALMSALVDIIMAIARDEWQDDIENDKRTTAFPETLWFEERSTNPLQFACAPGIEVEASPLVLPSKLSPFVGNLLDQWSNDRIGGLVDMDPWTFSLENAQEGTAEALGSFMLRTPEDYNCAKFFTATTSSMFVDNKNKRHKHLPRHLTSTVFADDDLSMDATAPVTTELMMIDELPWFVHFVHPLQPFQLKSVMLHQARRTAHRLMYLDHATDKLWRLLEKCGKQNTRARAFLSQMLTNIYNSPKIKQLFEADHYTEELYDGWWNDLPTANDNAIGCLYTHPDYMDKE